MSSIKVETPTLIHPATALDAPKKMAGSVRGPVVHRKKLFGGRQTAQEVHAAHAFPHDARCAGCGRAGGLQTRAIVFAPLDKMNALDPDFETIMCVDPMRFQSVLLPTKYGLMVKISTAYACPPCTPALGKSLAKLPDYLLVDLNYGPGADKIIR